MLVYPKIYRLSCIEQTNDYPLPFKSASKLEILVFDKVLVLFDKNNTVLDDVSRAIRSHGYLIVIVVIYRLEVMDNKRKADFLVVCHRTRQILIIIEIEFRQSIRSGDEIESNQFIMNDCPIQAEGNEHSYD